MSLSKVIHGRRSTKSSYAWPVFALLLTACGIGCRTEPVDAPGGTPVPEMHFPGANVLLIILDTVRADSLSCYGHDRETTPRIDEMAAEGMVFENCIAASNWTLPAHASIFTGLYPRSHGARSAEKKGKYLKIHPTHPVTAMKPSVSSLAEVLAKAGYDTAAFLANAWWLRPVFGVHQGFAEFSATLPESLQTGGAPYKRASEITKAALAWLGREERKERPFFLVLNYLDAHAPYAPPPPFDRRFLREDFPGDVDQMVETFAVLRNRPFTIGLPPRALDRELFVARYLGEIAYLDSEIGRLLDALRVDGRFDETIVVLVSDHGEALFEHGHLGHGQALYGEELRIPLIIRLPGGAFAARRTEMVSQVDIMPMLLDVLDLPIPDEVEGRSLVETVSEPVAAEFFRWKDGAWVRGVFDGRWAYTADEAGPEELYDLSVDPGEEINLADQRPAKLAEMRSALEAWKREAADLGEAEPAKLSPEEVERLRALGYLR